MARVYQRMSSRAAKHAGTLVTTPIWVELREARYSFFNNSGLRIPSTARAFGIRSPHAIIMKSRRDGWAVPSRVEERARQLQDSLQRRSEAAEQRRDSNAVTTETLARSWVERGEQHRALTFNLAHSELIAASKRGLPIEDWSDAEKADRMARKACGLDSEEGAWISIRA